MWGSLRCVAPTLIEEINKLAGIDTPVTPELIESIGGIPGTLGGRTIDGDTEVDTSQFIVGHQDLPLIKITNKDHVPTGRTGRR